MREVELEDKERFLNEYYPFANPPKMTDKRRCLQCDKVFTVGDFKIFVDKRIKEVFATDFLISCPNAPDCDVTVIDWVSIDD